MTSSGEVAEAAGCIEIWAVILLLLWENPAASLQSLKHSSRRLLEVDDDVPPSFPSDSGGGGNAHVSTFLFLFRPTSGESGSTLTFRASFFPQNCYEYVRDSRFISSRPHLLKGNVMELAFRID